MKEFEINEYITLKLELGETNIYINNEFFNQCKFLLLELPLNEISKFDEIMSIDEAAKILDHSMEGQGNKSNYITPETEFWGHCSNLQVWNESNYDTRLLHSNLSFPLLKKLSEVGDQTAKQVFREEIATRIKSKSKSVINFLLEERYLDNFKKEELEVVFEEPLFNYAVGNEKILNYLVFTYLRVGLLDLLIKDLKSIIKNYPNNAELWYHLGLTYYQASQISSHAINKFSGINTEKKPIHEYNFVHLNGNLEKSLNAFNEALKINSRMIKAWNRLTRIYKLQMKFDESFKASLQVLEINPDDKYAQYNLINLILNKREFKKFNIVEAIQQINLNEKLIQFDFKCPKCGKFSKTDFKRIKFCRYCQAQLSKSGKYKKYNLRELVAAGSWYPKNKIELNTSIENCFIKGKYSPGEILIPLNNQRTVIGGISPNSGYNYSGYASAHTFLNLFQENIPDTIIILSPDLVGYNKLGIMGGGKWETPLGNIHIDSELSLSIVENCQNMNLDDKSFINGILKNDHSIESQLPFIKYCSGEKNTKIVPILIPHNLKYEDFNELSLNIAKVIKQSKKDIISLAIGLLSHFSIKDKDDLKDYKILDKNFINSFKDFTPKVAYSDLIKIPGNGLGTITLLMLICKNLGGNKCKPLKYYTSYDMIGSGHYSGAYFSGVIVKQETL